jgi:hypothetical protein
MTDRNMMPYGISSTECVFDILRIAADFRPCFTYKHSHDETIGVPILIQGHNELIEHIYIHAIVLSAGDNTHYV